MPDDIKQIENIICDYSIFLDKGDFEGLKALLSECRLTIQITKNQALTLQGSDEIGRWVEENVVLYADGTPKTTHLNTNIRVWLADGGQTASANTHLTVLQKVAKTLQPIIIGFYDDEFRKVDATWRMTSRVESVISAGNMSGHGTNVPA